MHNVVSSDEQRIYANCCKFIFAIFVWIMRGDSFVQVIFVQMKSLILLHLLPRGQQL